LGSCVACCTRSDLHHASVAAFCAVSTKVCVAAFCAICIDVLTAALCGSSIMLLLLHSVQIPPRFLMLPAVQFPLMCTLLHSAGIPSCFSCCILCSFHQGLCCCFPFASMFLLLHSVGVPSCFCPAFCAVSTKDHVAAFLCKFHQGLLLLPAVQVPLMCTLLHSAGVPSQLSVAAGHHTVRSTMRHCMTC